MVGTLGRDLNLKVGEKYLCVYSSHSVVKEGEVYTITHPEYINGRKASWFKLTRFVKVSEGDKPKTWGEMTDAEKVALLLAKYEGKATQFFSKITESWELSNHTTLYNNYAYRIKPVPVIKTVTMQMHHNESGKPHVADHMSNPTHCIKYNTLDGKVDTSSIKMEEL